MTNNVFTPLDALESILAQWGCEHKRYVDELYAALPAHCGEYQLIATWNAEEKIIYFSCNISTNFKVSNFKKIANLIFIINEKLWLGHFDIAIDSGEVNYTVSNIIQDEGSCLPLIENILSIIMTECDRFYPAFESALIGNVSPQTAIDSAMLEVLGEA